MKKYWLSMLLALLILPLVTAAECTTETDYEAGDESVQGPQLTILSHSMTIDEWGYATVEGTARNDSDQRIDYAEIDVRFYNSAGHMISTSSDYISDLDPGQTWAFEVYCFEEDAASYDIGVGDFW